MRISLRLGLLAGLLTSSLALASAPRRAVILYTASLQGELEDCGCRGARGGLARRHAYVGQVRRDSPSPVFLVDVGDSLRRVPPGDRLARPDASRRDRFLVAMEERLGVDARALGPLDLALGWGRLAELLGPPPPLAANLRVLDEGARGPGPEPFRVITRSGVTLGFVGVAPDDLPPGATPGLEASPAVPAIRAAAAAARKAGAEVVVLVSTLGLSRDYRILREGLGVDLVLGGRSRDLLRRPLRQAGVPVMQAGIRGQAVGRVDLDLEPGALEVRHRVVDLTAGLPEDPAALAAVRRFLAESGAP